MLQKIEQRELLTKLEAEQKYPDKYFFMLITEMVDPTGQRDKGYVLYTADKRRELHDVPREELHGKPVASWYGNYVEDVTSIGDVICHG